VSANILFVEEKNNIEPTSNNFFTLFFFILFRLLI
jgi:hypothetical protein